MVGERIERWQREMAVSACEGECSREEEREGEEECNDVLSAAASNVYKRHELITYFPHRLFTRLVLIEDRKHKRTQSAFAKRRLFCYYNPLP